MRSNELVRKVRAIEIKSNKLVDEMFSGEYRSGFRGKGMEFDNIRQYMPGDDVRCIDWNVTARYGKAFVKLYVEEREMNVFLLVDMSRSNRFGQKKECIAEISATLAISAIRNHDRVGAIFFTDRTERLIPSQNGRKHALGIIESILTFEPALAGTSLANVLDDFNRLEKKRSLVFVISDFLDTGYEKQWKAAASRHDLIGVRVADRAEERIPAGAVFTFEDMETGEILVVDSMGRDFEMRPLAGLPGRNMLTVRTDEDYGKPLRMFFRKRGRR